MPQRVPATPGVTTAAGIADPVLIAAPERREARVEALGRDGDAAHDDIGPLPADETVEPSGERLFDRARPARGSERTPLVGGEVDVSHLPDRVHARVGAPGHDEAHLVLGVAQQRGDRLLELTLHRAQSRLTAPPREGRAVVRDIESQAHRLHNRSS